MDVMFVKDFQPAQIPHTAVVAVGAETRRAGSEGQSKDNPGVLYINIEVGSRACVHRLPFRAGS